MSSPDTWKDLVTKAVTLLLRRAEPAEMAKLKHLADLIEQAATDSKVYITDSDDEVLQNWNRARADGGSASYPKPDEMPRCPNCFARLVDRDPGCCLLSSPAQAWCECPKCGAKGMLRIW